MEGNSRILCVKSYSEHKERKARVKYARSLIWGAFVYTHTLARTQAHNTRPVQPDIILITIGGNNRAAFSQHKSTVTHLIHYGKHKVNVVSINKSVMEYETTVSNCGISNGPIIFCYHPRRQFFEIIENVKEIGTILKNNIQTRRLRAIFA